jgi:hypothetical protein
MQTSTQNAVGLTSDLSAELDRYTTMKAKMKDNLIFRYQTCKEFDYRQMGGDFMNELQAVKINSGMIDYFELKQFLKSIEGKIVDLVFTCGDAFEENNNNFWLPSELWEAV